LRGRVRPPGTLIRIDLSSRTRLRAGFRTTSLPTAVGRCARLRRTSRRPLLLGVARVGGPALGIPRWPARSHPVRAVELMDEYLLGRRRVGNCRMSDLRRPSPLEYGD